MTNLLWVTDQSLEGDLGYGQHIKELRDRGITIERMDFGPRVLTKLTISKYNALLFDVISHVQGQRLSQGFDDRVRGIIGLAMMTKRLCIRNRKTTRIITGPVEQGYDLDNGMSIAATCCESPYQLPYVQARDIYGSLVDSREFADSIQDLL